MVLISPSTDFLSLKTRRQLEALLSSKCISKLIVPCVTLFCTLNVDLNC